MKAFVVADAHGNWDAVEKLLRQEDVLVAPRKEVTLVHLGDLANCVKESVEDDVQTLAEAETVFDVLLVGNHEHPYWPGYIDKFSGFFYHPAVAEQIQLERYQAAYHFGGVLVTHAGLARQWEDEWQSADMAAYELNKMFEKDPAHAIFGQIGRARGGWNANGGILWSDYQEGKSRRFNQLYGHTPGQKIRRSQSTKFDTEHVCIDLGAKDKGKPIAGAWIDSWGNIDPVVLRETITRKKSKK